MARLTKRLLPLAALVAAAGCIHHHYPISAIQTDKPPVLGDELAQVPDSAPRVLRCDDGPEWIRIDRSFGFHDADAAWEASGGTLVWAKQVNYVDTCICPPFTWEYGRLPIGKPPHCTGWLRDDDEVRRLRARFPPSKPNTIRP